MTKNTFYGILVLRTIWPKIFPFKLHDDITRSLTSSQRLCERSFVVAYQSLLMVETQLKNRPSRTRSLYPFTKCTMYRSLLVPNPTSQELWAAVVCRDHD
jgi:hypothetical protein